MDDLTPLFYLADQMIRDDAERDYGFQEIDRAVSTKFETPDELRALSWIGNRQFPTTAFSDAANAATRAFATKPPKLTIFPAADDPVYLDMMERLETAIEWELERINRPGLKTAHWQIVESAMRYCAVALQVEYLPYTLKDWPESARKKSILRTHKFNWHVHNPQTVHARHSKYGLEAVLKMTQVSAQDLIDEFGDDNEGIAKLKREFEKDDRATRLTTFYNYFDLFQWDRRTKWAVPSTAGTVLVPSGGSFVFMDEDPKMPFIPWVIVDNQDPIMLPAIKAGLYDNANILNTIAFSKAVDMAAHPELWIRTMDGTLRNVSIDNTNPSQPMVTDKTVDVTQLRPPAIDPQLVSMQQEAKSDIFRSTVAQVLADISNIGSTATFSTVNAMLEAAVTQLALGQTAAEQAETLAVYQMFQWIDYSGIPLVAYRKHAKGENKGPGEELLVKSQYEGEDPSVISFDLDMLYLEMRLRSTSITDKQAELNAQVTMVERLGKSRTTALEDLNQKNPEVEINKRGEEDLVLATIQAESKRIMMQPDMEAAKAQAEAQAKAKAAAQGGQGGQGGAPTAPENMAGGMRGTTAEASQGMMDNRAGGAAPPGAGMNEMMTGMTRGGQGLA